MSFTKNAPDEEAVRLLRYYEGLALHYDVRGYCVCTSEGKDSRVLGHLMRRAGVRHFYIRDQLALAHTDAQREETKKRKEVKRDEYGR